MSRAARTARGAFGALSATLIAAASHAVAGGAISAWAVAATAILALPVCVLLAGRTRSLWRLTLAVGLSQGLYHWSFSGIGAATGASGDGTPLPLHAQHLAALGAGWAPSLGAAGMADAGSALNAIMWAAHGVAALLTIMLLSRGEHAVLALRELCALALSLVALPGRLAIIVRPRIRGVRTVSRQVLPRALSLSAISHRGPPRLCSRIPLLAPSY